MAEVLCSTYSGKHAWTKVNPDDFVVNHKTCESCTHNNDCSIQNAANLSGHGKGFSCIIHETKEEFIKKHSETVKDG